MIIPQHPRGLPALVEYYQKAVGFVFSYCRGGFPNFSISFHTLHA